MKKKFSPAEHTHTMSAICRWFKAKFTLPSAVSTLPSAFSDIDIAAIDDTNANQEETVDATDEEIDRRWLQTLHANRTAALANRTAALEVIVAQEMSTFQTEFITNVQLGVTCSCTFYAKRNHNETLTRLKQLGFIVCQQNTIDDEIFYQVFLPHSSMFSTDVEWRRWLRQIKRTYREARQQLVLKQFANIKAMFDIEALNGNLVIVVAKDKCFVETRKMLRKRLGCDVQKADLFFTIKV